MALRFIIIVLLFMQVRSASQIRPSELDSLNGLMHKNQPINLIKYGKARIELKQPTVFLNCMITEINSNYIVY